jgi:hypothetical protein
LDAIIMGEREVNLAALPSSLRLAVLFSQSLDHDERYSLLEKILEQVYEQLTDARQVFTKLSEDALTMIVVSSLRNFGILAQHDTQIGGHIDILIEASNGFRWIGEAKLDRGPAYILGGYDQLTTRYAVARPGANRGEIIIYSYKPRADRRLLEWRDRLMSERTANLVMDAGIEHLAFRTSSICPATGSLFYARHRIISIYHDPLK